MHGKKGTPIGRSTNGYSYRQWSQGSPMDIRLKWYFKNRRPSGSFYIEQELEFSYGQKTKGQKKKNKRSLLQMEDHLQIGDKDGGLKQNLIKTKSNKIQIGSSLDRRPKGTSQMEDQQIDDQGLLSVEEPFWWSSIYKSPKRKPNGSPHMENQRMEN